MAGRRPQPAGLRLLNARAPGRDSGGRRVAPPPPFKRLPPEAPRVLTGEALAEWERVVPELARLELTKPVDAAALTMYCLTWQRALDAQALIDAEGLLATTTGGVARHPAVAILAAASRELRQWCVEFGFTPASESKVSKESAEPASELNPFGAQNG
jgi:P27 family predicted phage terminase small subunit